MSAYSRRSHLLRPRLENGKPKEGDDMERKGRRRVVGLDCHPDTFTVAIVLDMGGIFEQIRVMHKELKPEKTLYCTGAGSVKEADDLIAWLKKNA
jgi:hypothetical protein